MGLGNRMQTKMQANGFFSIFDITETLGISKMAGVAQLVERWIVIPVVEGSNPFARPTSSTYFRDSNLQNCNDFFCLRA